MNGRSYLGGAIHLMDVDGNEIESLEIPSTVTSIGVAAFENCSSLTTIVIPTSVSKIGQRAFDGTSSLNYVFYKGTASQYSKVSREDAGSVLDQPYYYSEKKPSSGGNYWHYVGGTPTIWQLAQ